MKSAIVQAEQKNRRKYAKPFAVRERRPVRNTAVHFERTAPPCARRWIGVELVLAVLVAYWTFSS
jgi:hypothetical protein